MRSATKYVVLLALLLAPLPAFAWTVAAHGCASQVGGGDGSPLTSSSIDTTGSTLLILFSSVYSGAANVSVTDSKSNTWTGLTQITGSRLSRLWYAHTATVGSGHTFTITSDSGNMFNASFCVMALNGNLIGSDPFDVQSTNSNSASLTIAPGSITPSQNSEIVVTGYGSDANNTAPSVDSGFTLLDTVTGTGHNLLGLAYIVQGTAVAVNPTWSIDIAQNNHAAIASFKGPATARRPIGVTIFR